MTAYEPSRLEFARELGCGSAELRVASGCGFFPGDADWKARATEVKVAFEDRDLRISCLAAFYVNHMQRERAVEARKLVRDSIRLAEHLGVSVVAGFAGRVLDAPLEDSIKPFKKLWSQHAKFAEAHGVKIAFENCPMGPMHLPPGGTNCMCTPAMWEACFDAVPSEALGLEWDPSHLICQFIDPIVNLRRFGDRAYHVHAKDAHVNRDLLARHGVYRRGVIEHCMPGLGDTDWGLCIKELIRQGYDGDLNIEGWHDQVFRDHRDGSERRLEDTGLAIGIRHLQQFIPPGMD